MSILDEAGTGGEAAAEASSEAQGWLTSVPEDIRGHEVFKGMDKAGDVYTKLIDLSENSKGALKIPGENATEEEKTAFATSLNNLNGVPETIEGYADIVKPEGLPENMPWDEGMNDLYRETVHKANLNPTQAKVIFDAMNQKSIEQYNESVKTVADNKALAEAELKKDWAGDAYAANKEKAVRAFKKFGGDDGAKFMEESGLGNNPVMVKMFHSIYEAIGEDSFTEVSGSQGGGVETERDKALKIFPSMKDK